MRVKTLVQAIFVMVGVAALESDTTSRQAQPVAVPMNVVRIDQIFGAVPQQDSSVFRANRYPGLREITPMSVHDQTPFHVTRPMTLTVALRPGERAVLSGTPDGSGGWSIDNVLLLEIVGSRSAWPERFFVGVVGTGLEYLGATVPQVGPASYTQGPFDLTPLLGGDRRATVTFSAIDYGGVGYVSDLFLVTMRDPVGAPQPPPQTGAGGSHVGLWAARIAIDRQPVQDARFILGERCGFGIRANGTDEPLYTHLSIDGGLVRGEILGFATPTSWREVFTAAIAPDGNSAQGTFTNAGFPDQTGPMTWTRIPPELDLIATAAHSGNEMVLSLQGRHLPFAGPRRALLECGDAQFEEPNLTVVGHQATGNQDGTSVDLRVRLGPDVARGMKNLRLNGVRLRWNYRGPVSLSTLRFIEDVEGRPLEITEILNGVPFFVEAGYAAVPPAGDLKAQMTWPGGSLEVPLQRTTTDVKVFRSAPLQVRAPPAPTPAGVTELNLVGEETVTATLEDKTATARVQPFPEVVGIAFRDHLGNLLPERIENGVAKPAQIAAGERFAGVIEYAAGPNHDEQPVSMAVDRTAQPMTATRTDANPFVFETPLRRVSKPGFTVTLYAHGRAGVLSIVEPRIELFVRRPEQAQMRANVTSLTTEETFHVDVFVPPDMAQSIGDTLLVEFRTKGKGATASLRLKAHRSERGPTVYAHDDAVSLDLGGQGEGRTLNWLVEGMIPNSLVNLFSGGIDMSKMKSDKVDTLVVSYGSVSTEIPVYWSWRQRMLAEIQAAMNALRQLYSAGLLNPGVSREAKEQLNLRLNLIKNYDQVMAYEGDDFDDIRRLVAARGYFDMLSSDPQHWNPDYIPTNYAGTRSQRFGFRIGSRLEGEMLARLAEAGDQEYLNRFTGAMRDATIGLYQVVANSTGANQMLIVASGTDAMGRRVNTTERWLAGIDLISQAAMMGAASLKSAQLARQGAGGLDRARFVTEVRPKMADNVARDLILHSPPPRVPRPRVPADFRDRPTEAITEPVTDPPGPRPVGPPDPVKHSDVPDSLPPRTELTPSDVRALKAEAIRSTAERLGIASRDLDVNADIQATRGVSRTDGTIVLAERYGVPPRKLMSDLGVDASDVARALDDSYRAGGLADAAKRKVLVQKYLGDQAPANLDAIVSRNTPVTPVRPAPPLTPGAPPDAPDGATVRTDGVLTTPESPTVRTDRVITPPDTAPRPRATSPDEPTAGVPNEGLFTARPGAYTPPQTARRVTVRAPVSDAAPEFGAQRQTWRSPDDRRFVLVPVAEAKPGQRPPGRGANADVYAIAEGPSKGDVVKVFDNGRTDVKRVDMDAGGRLDEVRSSARELVEDIVYGAELLEAHNIPHLKVREAVLDNSRPYIVQERLRPTTDHVVSSLDTLNEAQQRAVVTLYDRLTNARIVWEDGHHHNIYLRDLGGGRWEAGILDTDRLAVWQQVPSQRLGYHLERPISAYGEARLGSLKGRGWGWEPANAREYMTKMFEHKGWIKYSDTGEFVPGPGRLDPKIVGEKFDLRVGPKAQAPAPAPAPDASASAYGREITELGRAA